MTSRSSACVAIEPDLIAAATGEAGASTASRVQSHIAGCATCRNDYAHYRAVDTVVGDLRSTLPAADAEDARRRLIERLADLRSRLVRYRVAPSPLGPILIAVTEHGVSLVEYLGRAAPPARGCSARPGWRPRRVAPISTSSIVSWTSSSRVAARGWTGRSISARRAAISSAR